MAHHKPIHLSEIQINNQLLLISPIHPKGNDTTLISPSQPSSSRPSLTPSDTLSFPSLPHPPESQSKPTHLGNTPTGSTQITSSRTEPHQKLSETSSQISNNPSNTNGIHPHTFSLSDFLPQALKLPSDHEYFVDALVNLPTA